MSVLTTYLGKSLRVYLQMQHICKNTIRLVLPLRDSSLLSSYVYTCIFAVSFTDNFSLFQKYGLQLFQRKYPPFVVNHDKTSTPVS